MDPKDRSPHQTFGRSTFEPYPTDDDTTPTVVARPGNPNYFAPDIEGLPWTRREGDRWTTPEFRQAVLVFIRRWLQSRVPPLLPATWSIEERRGTDRARLLEDAAYLRWRVSSGGRSGEVSMPFPRTDRSGAPLQARLALWAQSMDTEFGIQ